MTEAVGGWVLGHLQTLIWDYVSAHWLGLAAFLIGATAACIAIRKLVALYGYLPLIIGVVMLIIAAWALGYNTAPVRTVVRPVVQTKTVEVKVIDDTEINRLRKELAERDAAFDQADAARRNAEAALSQLRQEMAAAKNEIQRLLAELAAKPNEVMVVEEDNARCPRCGRLFHVGSLLLERGESIRCPNMRCHIILSARSAVANRTYTQNRRQ